MSTTDPIAENPRPAPSRGRRIARRTMDGALDLAAWIAAKTVAGPASEPPPQSPEEQAEDDLRRALLSRRIAAKARRLLLLMALAGTAYWAATGGVTDPGALLPSEILGR